MARLLHAKAGPLPSGVGGREPSVNRRRGQSRSDGAIARSLLVRPPPPSLGSRPCRSNAQVDPKANGADRVLTEWCVVRCLSRMH